MIIPSHVANQIYNDFLNVTKSHDLAKECSVIHIEKMIKYFKENNRLVQCVISINDYSYVLLELKAICAKYV